MPTPLLGDLFCSPQDIFDWLGTDAVQLREDDRNQASGQTVATTVAAVLGATSLTITALQYGMLKGTVLQFQNAGMDTPLEVTLSAAAVATATTLSVVALTADLPSGAQATDNGVNVWLAGMGVRACQYATSRVKLYCTNRYQASDLYANSQSRGSVNEWAVTIAARWIGSRVYRSPPSSVDEKYQETMAELKSVQSGQLAIESIGTRSAGWPFMDNLTGIDWLTYTKTRVESLTSDPIPSISPQFVDWNSVFSLEALY